MTPDGRSHVVIIGGGFTGLAAAWELTQRGFRVTVCEAEEEVGGLAGSFDVGGTRLEKFYHHWFTSDTHVIDLVNELGQSDRVLHRPTRTGMYYAHRFFRLSTPMDVLRFTPLSVQARIRLGLLALRARRVRHWKELEDLTAEEWLTRLGGREVYEIVWKPLLKGKFGSYASEISASLRPLRRAARRCSSSSSMRPSATSAVSVTELRVRRSRPGRAQISPHA